MANLAVQTLSAAGTNVTFAASAASDTAHVGNGRNTVLILHNGTGAPVTWTVLVPGNTFLGVATDDNAVTVPAGEYRYVLLVKDYADDTSRATITTASPAAGIEAAVVRMG
jgi:hypothetical protein